MALDARSLAELNAVMVELVRFNSFEPVVPVTVSYERYEPSCTCAWRLCGQPYKADQVICVCTRFYVRSRREGEVLLRELKLIEFGLLDTVPSSTRPNPYVVLSFYLLLIPGSYQTQK